MDRYILRRIEKWFKTRVIAWSYRDLPFDMWWTTEEMGRDIAKEQFSSIRRAEENKVIASFVHNGKWWVIEDNNKK